MNVRRPRVGKIPHKTTSCSEYTRQRTEELTDDQMCHPDLYAYIKVFGNEDQRFDLVNLKSKVRRKHLLPLYLDVKAGRPNGNGNNGGGNNGNNGPPRRPGKEPMNEGNGSGLLNIDTTSAAYHHSRTSNNDRKWYDDVMQTLFSKRNYDAVLNKSEKFKRARNTYLGNKKEFDYILAEMFSEVSQINTNQRNGLLREMLILQ